MLKIFSQSITKLINGGVCRAARLHRVLLRVLQNASGKIVQDANGQVAQYNSSQLVNYASGHRVQGTSVSKWAYSTG